MSNNTEWIEATDSIESFEPGEFSDNFGSENDQAALGIGEVMIQGTPEELVDLGLRIVRAAVQITDGPDILELLTRARTQLDEFRTTSQLLVMHDCLNTLEALLDQLKPTDED